MKRKLGKTLAAAFVLIAAVPFLPGASADPGTLVWDLAGSPYHITGTFSTPTGSHFVIEDGVRVLLGPGAVINSLGTIEVRGGTLGVTFTSDGPRQAGYWGTLILAGGGSVRGARFESASRAIHSTGPLTVSDSTFDENGIGVYAQLARADLGRVVSRGGSVGFYWDHAPGSITDADISGSTWGIYLYAPDSDVAVTRVNVHDMRTDSYALTTINNRPVIRESHLVARISVFLPACASDALVVDTWIDRVFTCYYNRIAVWNFVRAGTFSPAGTPVPGFDARIDDNFGPQYRSPGFGGGDPRTGADGWGGRALLLDWSWVPGLKTVNSASVGVARGAFSASAPVDVSYRLDVPFIVPGNEPPVPRIDFYRTALIEARVTGTPGNSVRLTYEEDGRPVGTEDILRQAGPPNVASMSIEVHEGGDQQLRLNHLPTRSGANPVHLRVSGGGGDWVSNVLLSTKGDSEVLVPLGDALARALAGVREYAFDATASSDPDGTIVAYSWEFGDSAGGSGAVVSHAYSVPGDYTVRLTVTDDDGDSATAEIVVSVR